MRAARRRGTRGRRRGGAAGPRRSAPPPAAAARAPGGRAASRSSWPGVVRALGQRHVQLLARAVRVLDLDADDLVGLVAADRAGDVAGTLDPLAADRGDDVAAPDPRVVRRALRAGHQRALAPGGVRGLDPQVRVLDGLALLEPRDDLAHRVRRHREADADVSAAAVAGLDLRVDADHPRAAVEQRAARVAGVDG